MEEVGNHGVGDPWEVFTQLVIQIIEGRTPGGEKGFRAGPHCSLNHQTGLNRHACDPDSAMVRKGRSLELFKKRPLVNHFVIRVTCST